MRDELEAVLGALAAGGGGAPLASRERGSGGLSTTADVGGAGSADRLAGVVAIDESLECIHGRIVIGGMNIPDAAWPPIPPYS
jgi:hypothetical protein